ncbi:DUF2147 domain-containing protein [Lacibacter luteus]|uniref:DUF2147 domain-containing protein n=1 Tax=Lacibacter luteus TaxID=2508719 RepID=A0A4Q1CMF8_9BACT|nr:DUF2147 domain-containing protein [Lacibacter luteus]RXK61915.1 DUF2147 domain-containing protein [Lacibacter luteus]
MKKLAYIKFTLCCTILFLSFTLVQDNPDAIIGSWKNGEGTGIIQIYKNGDKYQGKIIWLKEPNDPETGKPKLDKNHPDEVNHKRPVMGLVNMWGFKYTDKNEWTGGKIYDPKNGKTYSCKMSLDGATKLKVRGYIGVSLIGRTDTWTKQ